MYRGIECEFSEIEPNKLGVIPVTKVVEAVKVQAMLHEIKLVKMKSIRVAATIMNL